MKTNALQKKNQVKILVAGPLLLGSLLIHSCTPNDKAICKSMYNDCTNPVKEWKISCKDESNKKLRRECRKQAKRIKEDCQKVFKNCKETGKSLRKIEKEIEGLLKKLEVEEG